VKVPLNPSQSIIFVIYWRCAML